MSRVGQIKSPSFHCNREFLFEFCSLDGVKPSTFVSYILTSAETYRHVGFLDIEVLYKTDFNVSDSSLVRYVWNGFTNEEKNWAMIFVNANTHQYFPSRIYVTTLDERF